MSNKKSQGLPMSFIVLAAISALILVLIVFFVTGAGGKLLGTITGGQETDLAVAQSQCQSLCSQVQLATSVSQYKASAFCKNKFNVKDGAEKSIVSCWGGSTNLKVSFTSVPCETNIGDILCKGDVAKKGCVCTQQICVGKVSENQEACSVLTETDCKSNDLCVWGKTA